MHSQKGINQELFMLLGLRAVGGWVEELMMTVLSGF